MNGNQVNLPSHNYVTWTSESKLYLPFILVCCIHEWMETILTYLPVGMVYNGICLDEWLENWVELPARRVANRWLYEDNTDLPSCTYYIDQRMEAQGSHRIWKKKFPDFSLTFWNFSLTIYCCYRQSTTTKMMFMCICVIISHSYHEMLIRESLTL